MRAALLALFMVSACATSPPQPSLGLRAVGTISVAEAQDLNQDEFRQRLGLSADGQTWVDVVYVEEGRIAYLVTRETLLQGSRCPPIDGQPHTRMAIRGADAFVFRDGRFVGATSGGNYSDLTDGRPVGSDRLISLMCWYASQRADGGNIVGDLIMVAPWTPLYVVALPLMLAPDTQEHLLSTIRVGEQLPGGYQQFLEANRSHVQVESASGDDVELSIRNRGATSEGSTLARIRLHDGAVVRIDLRDGCLLSDRTIRCPG